MALTKLKIAVFAPMPSASVSTATVVKPGFFSNWRKANLRSLITQSFDRIDLCRPAGWQPASERSNDHQQQRGGDQRGRVGRAYAVKQAHDHAAGDQDSDESNRRTDDDESQ